MRFLGKVPEDEGKGAKKRDADEAGGGAAQPGAKKPKNAAAASPPFQPGPPTFEPGPPPGAKFEPGPPPDATQAGMNPTPTKEEAYREAAGPSLTPGDRAPRSWSGVAVFCP